MSQVIPRSWIVIIPKKNSVVEPPVIIHQRGFSSHGSTDREYLPMAGLWLVRMIASLYIQANNNWEEHMLPMNYTRLH